MAKLVWRVKLVAELGSGIVSETEVARIERDDFAVAETVGLTLDKGKRVAASTQAEIVRAQVATIGERFRWCEHCNATLLSKGYYPARFRSVYGDIAVRINHSRWDCMLERAEGCFLAVRLGLRMVKGLSNAHAADIVAARGERLYGSVDELWRRARVPPAALERLAEADAFQGLGLERRAAVWAIRGLRDEVLPLFAAADEGRAPRPEIVEPPFESFRWPLAAMWWKTTRASA